MWSDCVLPSDNDFASLPEVGNYLKLGHPEFKMYTSNTAQLGHLIKIGQILVCVQLNQMCPVKE